MNAEGNGTAVQVWQVRSALRAWRAQPRAVRRKVVDLSRRGLAADPVLANAAPVANGIDLVVPRRLDSRAPVIITAYWAIFASTFFTESPLVQVSPILGGVLTAFVLLRWLATRKNPRPPIRIDRAGLTLEAQGRVVPWANIAAVGVAGGWNVRPRRHRTPPKIIWQLTDGTWFEIETARIAMSAEQVVLATHSHGVRMRIAQQQPMPEILAP